MNDETEEDRPPPFVPAPRPRLVPCQVQPMEVETTHRQTIVTQADLAAHAGRPDVAGALCVSSTFTTVYTGGARMPDLTHLYTRRPMLLEMWPGDALRFAATKPGRVLLVPVVPETAAPSALQPGLGSTVMQQGCHQQREAAGRDS